MSAADKPAPPARSERSEIDPELLERLRTSGISVDREGRFWHEGALVEHAGLRQALWRWLDRLPPPDGRYVFRLDARRFAFLTVEDTPLVATSLRWQDQRAWLGLNDGTEEELDPSSLTLDQAGVLRCWVRTGKVEARLATSAATALAERITPVDGRAQLATDSGPVVIRAREGADPSP